MRFHILRALLKKELRRHLANRGGIALAVLMIAAAVLLSVFNPTTPDGGSGGGDLVGGVHHCYVESNPETDITRQLKERVPPALKAQIVFRNRPSESVDALITDSPGTCCIRMNLTTREGRPWLAVEIWHPPGDPGAVAPYEAWFFRTTREILQEFAKAKLERRGIDASKLAPLPPASDDLWAVRHSFEALEQDTARLAPNSPDALLPKVEIKRAPIGASPLDFRSAIATAMVVFALYFCCCYLLPTLNCEERERGVLLAQALSPASPAEIVAAKFLFYPVAGIVLAAILAGIYNPAVLNTLFFWLALLAMSSGFLGIGMTVSTLAKTQRGAFMGSMCYLMSVSLLLFICSHQRHSIPAAPRHRIPRPEDPTRRGDPERGTRPLDAPPRHIRPRSHMDGSRRVALPLEGLAVGCDGYAAFKFSA